MDLLTFLPATFLGYKFFKVVSDDRRSTVAKQRPQIKIWRFQFSPNLRVFVKGRVIHMHHWINLSILLTFTFFLNMGFMDYMFTKGLMVGGILQGLTFPDFKNVVYRAPDYTNIISIPSTTEAVKETS